MTSSFKTFDSILNKFKAGPFKCLFLFIIPMIMGGFYILVAPPEYRATITFQASGQPSLSQYGVLKSFGVQVLDPDEALALVPRILNDQNEIGRFMADEGIKVLPKTSVSDIAANLEIFSQQDVLRKSSIAYPVSFRSPTDENLNLFLSKMAEFAVKRSVEIQYNGVMESLNGAINQFTKLKKLTREVQAERIEFYSEQISKYLLTKRQQDSLSPTFFFPSLENDIFYIGGSNSEAKTPMVIGSGIEIKLKYLSEIRLGKEDMSAPEYSNSSSKVQQTKPRINFIFALSFVLGVLFLVVYLLFIETE